MHRHLSAAFDPNDPDRYVRETKRGRLSSSAAVAWAGRLPVAGGEQP